MLSSESSSGRVLGKIEIIDMNFESLIPALQSGKIDFALSNFNVTEERKTLWFSFHILKMIFLPWSDDLHLLVWPCGYGTAVRQNRDHEKSGRQACYGRRPERQADWSAGWFRA